MGQACRAEQSMLAVPEASFSRGDVVILSGGDGRATLAVVVQSDAFRRTSTVMICPIVATDPGAPLLRLIVEPSDVLPLERAAWIALEQVTTIPRDLIRGRIGHLAHHEVIALDRGLLVILGVA
jgi:mRNA-degrading endonuclease toxin of MazEF toxin-antitoxin module